jgi:hypothetical protein
VVEESLIWFPRYHDVPDWYIKDRIRDGLRVPAHVWMAVFAGLTAAVPPSESGTITAPTLIIWGERDQLLPLQDGYLLAAAIPGSRLIVYEDTGHLVLPDRRCTVTDQLAGGQCRTCQTSPLSVIAGMNEPFVGHVSAERQDLTSQRNGLHALGVSR